MSIVCWKVLLNLPRIWSLRRGRLFKRGPNHRPVKHVSTRYCCLPRLAKDKPTSFSVASNLNRHADGPRRTTRSDICLRQQETIKRLILTPSGERCWGSCSLQGSGPCAPHVSCTVYKGARAPPTIQLAGMCQVGQNDQSATAHQSLREGSKGTCPSPHTSSLSR